MFKIYSPNHIKDLQGKSVEEAILIAARYKLNQVFEENLGKEILFLTSGGSAFKLLDGFNQDNFSSNLTIAVLDERAYSEKEINNFSQLKETEFYKLAKEKGCSFISTELQNEEKSEDLAERFEKELRNWKSTNPNGVVIATLGMGPDGHTSGVMPFPENEKWFNETFVDTEKWVEPYDAQDKNQYPFRVTTTLNFLQNEIDYAIAYISGENKVEALKKALVENGSLAETPARVFKSINLILVTDLTL